MCTTPWIPLDVLHDKQPIDLIWLALGSPAIAEIAAHARPGAIVIDMQHGLWDRASLEAAVGIVRNSTRVIVRCADDSPTSIAQALDSGAHSVLIHLIESGRAAADAASASRYPPEGTRSAGGVRPPLRGIETLALRKPNSREAAVGVMIETVAGVEQPRLRDCSEKGVDYIFIGTGDLAMSRGATLPADIERDCEQVRRAALASGLPLRMSSAADAAMRLEAGYALAVVANDIELVRRAGGRCARRAEDPHRVTKQT